MNSSILSNNPIPSLKHSGVRYLALVMTALATGLFGHLSAQAAAQQTFVAVVNGTKPVSAYPGTEVSFNVKLLTKVGGKPIAGANLYPSFQRKSTNFQSLITSLPPVKTDSQGIATIRLIMPSKLRNLANAEIGTSVQFWVHFNGAGNLAAGDLNQATRIGIR